MNALSSLQRLIDAQLAARSLNGQARQVLSSDIQQLLDEKDRVLMDFEKNLISLGRDQREERFVQFYQHKIIELMNVVSDSLNGTVVAGIEEESERERFEIIYDLLEELLVFLETRYTRYMDTRCKLPFSHYTNGKLSISEGITEMTGSLMNAGLPAGYPDIVMKPFLDFIATERSTYSTTYEQLYYLKELKQGIQRLINEERVSDMPGFLISMNFNDADYYRYAVKMMSEEIEELVFSRQQLKKISWLKKSVGQQSVRRELCFDYSQPSLQEQLLLWLKEEREHIEYTREMTEAENIPEDLRQWANFKIRLPISVYHLACGIKVLKEAEVLDPATMKRLVKFVANFVSTIGKEDVSEHSIFAKMYSITMPVKKSVKDFFISMANIKLK